MGLSKTELLQSGSVSSQDALVRRLQDDKRPRKPRKVIIPGGKRMLETLDKDGLEKAVYNWLRGVRAFSSVTISFAKNPEKFASSEEKVYDFPQEGPREVWETHPRGRRHLAEVIAGIISKNQLVTLTARKEGVYICRDKTKSFAPTKEVTKKDVTAQKKLIDQMREEHNAKYADSENAPAFNEPLALEAGQRVPSDEWEPYIEFIEKAKKQYGY